MDPVGVVRRTAARRVGPRSVPRPRSRRLGSGRAASRPRRLLAEIDLELPAHLAELGLEVLPLADAQVVEVLPLAHPPEGARRQLALLGAQVPPEVQPGQEVRGGVLEAGVQLVGLGLLLQRPLPRVLQREGGGDDEDLADAAEPLGLEDHPSQPGVDRQPGEPPADPGQPRLAATAGERPELLEQLHAGGDVASVGRLDEGEAAHVTEPERGHLEDHGRQVGAQDLGVGEVGPALEVLLGVQPDRDARLDPPAAAGPLACRGLADRLDREPLHLGLQRVARDPRQPGVHDVPDAGDGQRGLGDVRGEDDAAHGGGVGREDTVLLGGREPGEEGDDLEGSAAVGPQVGQRVGGVADLALAGEEHQDVAGTFAGQLADRVEDRLRLVADDRLPLVVGLGYVDQRAVADLDGVGASRHLDDRRRPRRLGGRARRDLGEVSREPLGVDGRGGDHQLEVGAPGQELLEVAEQEVDVEAPLVRLVDDDRVVAAQLAVALQLGQQDAVGHHLDPGVRRGPVGEADLVADLVAQRRLRLRPPDARPPTVPRSGEAGCAPPSRPVRPRRGRARGRSWAAGWSFPSRSRPRRRRPGGPGWPPRCRHAAG